MAKKQENYLEFVPVISGKNSWDKDETGKVTIHMVHRGFYAWIAQKFFLRPWGSHIHLDAMGPFWSHHKVRVQDGKKASGQVIGFLLDRQYIGPADGRSCRLKK